jgi:hypothetical protein
MDAADNTAAAPPRHPGDRVLKCESSRVVERREFEPGLDERCS